MMSSSKTYCGVCGATDEDDHDQEAHERYELFDRITVPQAKVHYLYPFIIAIEPHHRRAKEWVVLGRESADPGSYFTRRVLGTKDGAHFWGGYRMSLQEAVEDFEQRRNS